MRRRRFLQTGVSAVAFTATGSAVTGRERAEAAYAPVAELPLRGAKELVMGDDREYAYVAVTDGFAVVDLSDPTSPALSYEERDLLSDHEEGPLRQIYDVKVDGSTLVVAGPANGGGVEAFVVYDVSDPANPVRTGTREVNSSTHNCFVDGDYLYTTANYSQYDNPMLVYDLREDGFPRVGNWSPLEHDERWTEVNRELRNLHDIYVQDGVAYLAYWDAGTWLVDVSDPTDPSFVSRFGDHTREELAEIAYGEGDEEFIGSPGNSHYTTVNEESTLLAVGKESWQPYKGAERGPSGIDLWDVSDEANPRKLSTIEPAIPEDGTQTTGVETTAHNVDIHGDRMYSSWYQDGVKVHDIGDPSNPELLAHWRTPESRSFWAAAAVQPGEYFAASNYGSVLGEHATVMVFPDEVGTQSNMPLLEPTPTPTPSPTPTATPTATQTSTPTTAPTDTPTDVSTATPTGTDTGDTNTSSPGFGPLAALGGLALGGWRLLRTRRTE